ERTLARRSRQPREPRQRAQAVSALAATRLRRSRVLAANILVLALALVAFGVEQVLMAGDWAPVVAGAIGVFAGLALLQRAATVAAAHRAVEAVDHAVVVPEAPRSFTDWQRTEQARPTWTPVPLPKPLYLSKEEAAGESSDAVAVAASLDTAAARSDEALRSASSAPEVAVLEPRRSQTALAAMGIVAESGPVLTDLDAVLRRRRAG
ncbi:MAG: rane protein, partial [Amnibacterium sp.]|nr:rane protein [Amnibacterium sp.]